VAKRAPVEWCEGVASRLADHARLLWLYAPSVWRRVNGGASLTARLMQDDQVTHGPSAPPGSDQIIPQAPRRPRKRILLVRHGQTPFNVEGRLPGQLPGITLTEEGRRQAYQAAVALAGSPLSAVVSSPLERAMETAQIIARGWGLAVRVDPRLMDVDVGSWAGQKLDELKKADPGWTSFIQDASYTPVGGESLITVMTRSVAAIEDVRLSDQTGDSVAVVAHADVIKLIIAHYLSMDANAAHHMYVANGSISGLSFGADGPPTLLALNWTAGPEWLFAPPERPAATDAQALPTTQPTSAVSAHVGDDKPHD
jgi:broad specificity phosphatase PhoE